MTAASAIAKIYISVQDTVKKSSGSVINIVICLVTVGSEKFFSLAAFRCPCVVNATHSKDAIRQNFLYGWVFIIVPAFALFVLGCGMNVKTWKVCTGCCKRSKSASRGCIAVCCTIMEILVQAFVAPMTWMTAAFLDGKYYACAASVKPYLEACGDVNEKRTNSLKMSMEFTNNKQCSQIVGWILGASTLLLGFIIYAIYRCCSPLTYYHRKYAKWYREEESKAFEEKAKAEIKQEVEKETVARFLLEKRPKGDWDKISTVFNFVRDNKGYALYSRLDEWNENYKADNPLPSEAEKAVEATEDESSLDPLKINNNNSSSNISLDDNATNVTFHSTPNTFSAFQPSGQHSPNSLQPKSSAGEQVIPRLPPPPLNPGDQRPYVTSQDDLMLRLPNGIPQSLASPLDKKTLRYLRMTAASSDNDATGKSELIMLDEVSLQKSKNLGNVRCEANSTEEYTSAPTYDDEDVKV